ncbi:hypothetical protein B0H14DRAFT_3475457 [Mycena olivaceomarginata]|nr:hypothetical protein B0H14DRAFT_3475457 [Mycena olivaceomarginata]
MTSPNKPAIPPPFLSAKSTTSSWTGLGRRRQQQQQWTPPIANTAVNNHTKEEDEDDLYEEPPDNDLEDKGEEEEEEEEEGEDGLEGRVWARMALPLVLLVVNGPTSILTVTDNLLKNDGCKFLEMMEQLAELRLAHEEEAVGSVSGDERMPFTAMFTQQQQPMSPRSLYVLPPYGFGPCLSSIHHQQQQGIPTPCGFPPMPANMGMVLVLWANSIPAQAPCCIAFPPPSSPYLLPSTSTRRKVTSVPSLLLHERAVSGLMGHSSVSNLCMR